ncbi:MAG: MFS transporter [Anaerolineales bacterium]
MALGTSSSTITLLGGFLKSSFGIFLPARYNFKSGKFLFFSLIGMIGWAISQSVTVMLIAMFPMAIGAGSFNALINSAISKAVNRDEIGGMLGFGSGLESATRIVMPALASYLLGAYGASTPGILGSVVMFIVLVYAFLKLRPQTADREHNNSQRSSVGGQ